jgi:hypothetical protein
MIPYNRPLHFITEIKDPRQIFSYDENLLPLRVGGEGKMRTYT